MREDILNQVGDAILKDRSSTHGEPERNFQDIAEVWSWYLGDRLSEPVSAHDVAVMQALVKVARIKSSPSHVDNWVDMAGYAVCGGEVATSTPQENPYNDRKMETIGFAESLDWPDESQYYSTITEKFLKVDTETDYVLVYNAEDESWSTSSIERVFLVGCIARPEGV